MDRVDPAGRTTEFHVAPEYARFVPEYAAHPADTQDGDDDDGIRTADRRVRRQIARRRD